MFHKTDMAKSRDAQNQSAFMPAQNLTDNVVQISSSLNHQINNKYLNNTVNYLKRLSLSTKAIILAIAVGTLPILSIGAIAYNLLNKSINEQITKAQQTEAITLADTVNQFISERYQDIQTLSNLPFLTNYKVREVKTNADKQAVLNQIIQTNRNYDSIAVFDMEGELIAQSGGEPLDTQKYQNYFQEILKKNVPVVSQAELSSLYLAAPIKDAITNETIAVVRVRMPMQSLAAVMRNYSANGQTYNLLDSSGKIILSSKTALLNTAVTTEYPSLAPILTNQKIASVTTVGQLQQKAELVSYIPLPKIEGLSNLNWQVLLTTDATILFAPQRQLLWTIAIGTVLTACIVSAIAAWLAQRITQSLIQANAALAKLGQGEFHTRLQIEAEDELGLLNANINQVAENLQTLVKHRTFVIPSFDNEQQPEALQLQLLELLSNVEGAARGDLTVRADVTTGAIGTVADFFNSIVENLRDIVTQVKQAASQLNTAIGSNEGAIRQLAEEALIQAAEINRTLEAVDNMTNSMKTVAINAQQAAIVANHAAHTATSSEQAMDLTVQNILNLRETVGETARKVKRLGESSQEISRVVSIINQIATQTNLLAINASIEAARAGEEGQGFAVVAEEIGELAARSATATQEIEYIVENIQRETSEVAKAMEIGTTQVVEGTQIVETAKQSLSQILNVSQQIDSLIQSISTATTSQVETSQTVNQLMQNIAAISQRTSDSSHIVAKSLQQTVEISHQLQETVGTFKVS
ncbi:methyl-accepting chemotaxis protein [Nostoc sp. PCC 7524]|uniref:methyl-accepting chemotaxis protein n=1 Tax=Nostoc sp. (strain ATCC 29411 / PCC 7524) TaxID=28072 RepID=UPI00029EEFC2|nr:methyl-accepting chemotaxis protein [Nostoc sp. PCC 7524]AFY46460.1 methyl-accepting chemotaxis protein [Nostoc sp. PCC 7524]